jgi:hypothetical protein
MAKKRRRRRRRKYFAMTTCRVMQSGKSKRENNKK